jgi:AcrR family transcriptional regulator
MSDSIDKQIKMMKATDNNDMESRIIEAAKRVFVRKGYEATTMGDIAAEVNISRTAMHYYFRTKEMMFEAIFVQLMDGILPNIDLIMDEQSCLLEKLPKIVEQYITALRNNLMFPLFVINEMNRDPAHLFRSIAKDPKRIYPMLRLKQQILEEMEQGRIKRLPLEDIISTFIGLIVFPILIRPPLTMIFMDGRAEAFDEMIDRRAELIYTVMHHLLAPEEKK